MQFAGGSNDRWKTSQKGSGKGSALPYLEQRAQEIRTANLHAKTKAAKINKSASIISGKKSLEKPKRAQALRLNIGGGVKKARPRPRHGLRQLKECIRMQQSSRSAIRESPFRRHLNKYTTYLVAEELTNVPYHHMNDKTGVLPVMYKSVGAINSLRAMLIKKAVDTLRRAASYTKACGRRTVSDKDIVRAAQEDDQLKWVVETNPELAMVVDDSNVDGDRTRAIWRITPFVGVKALIYHKTKDASRVLDDDDDQDEQEDE